METPTTDDLSAWGEIALGYAFDIAGALIILVVGWIIAGWCNRYLRRSLKRSERIEPTLVPFIASIVRYAILIFVFIAVLAQFGVQTTSIIAVLGAAGLAIGFALQGTLQNIAAGFMLLFLRPFRVGDYIEAGGAGGTVEEIGLFLTTMTSIDGLYLAVPNSQLWGSTVTNWSRATVRRVDMAFGIGYGDDMGKGLEILTKMATADARVHKDPEPVIAVHSLGESSVDLKLRFWCDPGDYWGLTWDFNRAGKERLEAAGLSIPYPQRDVHLIPAPEST